VCHQSRSSFGVNWRGLPLEIVLKTGTLGDLEFRILVKWIKGTELVIETDRGIVATPG
jgi:hypothetical protein